MGPEGARLRAMTSLDLPAVVAIENACQPTPWGERSFRDCLHNGYHCRVATIGGEPVAFILLSSVLDETHLVNVAVAPAWQRRGLALWMLQDALDRAQAASMSVLFLEVRASNRGAQRLYQRLGFRETGRRKGYYRTQNGREDAVLMTLEFVAHK